MKKITKLFVVLACLFTVVSLTSCINKVGFVINEKEALSKVKGFWETVNPVTDEVLTGDESHYLLFSDTAQKFDGEDIEIKFEKIDEYDTYIFSFYYKNDKYTFGWYKSSVLITFINNPTEIPGLICMKKKSASPLS